MQSLTRRSLLRECAMLAVSVVTACRQTGGGQQAGQPAVQARPPVTIEVLTRPGLADPCQCGHSQWYATITPKLFTPETNITVNFIEGQPNVTEKLLVLAAADTLPDVSWFAVVADHSGGRAAASKGIFKPLDDLAKKDPKFDRTPYFKALLDAFTVDGKLYALPTHGHYGTNVLYYNANLIKAAGITVPQDGSWTIDDFIVAAQKVVRKEDDVWGYMPGDLDISESGVFFVRQFGGEFLDEAGRRCLLDSPEARAGLEWVYNLQAKFQTIDTLFPQGGFVPRFQAGKLAFFSNPIGAVALYKKPGQQIVTFEVGVALFPKHPRGWRGSQASGGGMGITGTQKQEASWEWIKFITSKEVGVLGVTEGGAGAPGARIDVWNDPRLLTFDPIFRTMVTTFPQGPASLRLPANHRRTELVQVVNEELRRYLRGEVGLNEATARAVQQANVILAS
jgi:ABC-type glycerol-3-phosphate transport system substrate-binding protein